MFNSKNGKGKFSVTNGALFIFERTFFYDPSPHVFYTLQDEKGRWIYFYNLGFYF